MASFEILLGGRRVRRAASDTVEVRSEIGERAAIDIFVDGANVSARAAPDDPVAVVRALVRGIDQLGRGRAAIARVPFYEGPWELYLARRGDDALVTFLRAGASPEVVVKDAPVPLRSVAEAAVRAAERVEGAGAAGTEGLTTEARGALRHALSPAGGPSVPAPGRLVHAGSWARPPAVTPLAFGLCLAVPHATASADRVGAEADLYPLLVTGELGVWHRGRRCRITTGYPFLHVERILRATHATLEAFERRKPSHVRLQSDGLLFSVRLVEKGDVEIELASPMAGARRAPDPFVVTGIPLRELARAAHALARAFRRAVSEGPPSMRRNLRVAELCADARRLVVGARDLATTSSVLCSNPDSYRGRIEGAEEIPAGPPLSEARRIRFTEKWRLEAEGLDLSSTFVCGSRVLVATPSEVLAVERDHGDLTWRRSLPPATVSFPAKNAGLARLEADGHLRLHGFAEGDARWSARLEPHAGGLPFVAAAAPPDAPPLLLVTEGLRRLTALDLRTGERRWRFTARRGGAFKVSAAGVLSFVVSGDSVLTAIETSTGRVAWRFGERACFSEPPLVMREAVVVAAPLGDDATIVAGLEAASGELLWRRIVEGHLAGPPLRLGAASVLRLAHGPGTALLALEPSTGKSLWRGVLGAPPEDATILGNFGALYAATGTGHVLCLEADTGVERWRTYLPVQGGRPLPRHRALVPCGDALFVGTDAVHLLSPADGRVLHRLPEDSPVPDLLRVDERASVYAAEEGGTLACYGIGAALRVV